MEEDDDNFLGGVIEFGDGRQYKVKTGESPTDEIMVRPLETTNDKVLPAGKEDRFGDDFDRTWPRSGRSPTPSRKDNKIPLGSHISSSSQESSRVLFNERSNRLEPYSSVQRPSQFAKRGLNDSNFTTSDTRIGWDGTLPSPSRSHVSLSHKPVIERIRQPSESSVASSSLDRWSSGPRRDLSGVSSMGPPSPRLSRDVQTPRTSLFSAKDLATENRGRKTSFGASQHSQTLSSKESIRQLPPHLSSLPSNSSLRNQPLNESKSPITASEPRGLSPRRGILSSVGSTSTLPPILTRLPPEQLEEARKDVMQTAAARAKQRRLEEEKEREKAQERARQKALELEERLKKATLLSETVPSDKVRIPTCSSCTVQHPSPGQ